MRFLQKTFLQDKEIFKYLLPKYCQQKFENFEEIENCVEMLETERQNFFRQINLDIVAFYMILRDEMPVSEEN